MWYLTWFFARPGPRERNQGLFLVVGCLLPCRIRACARIWGDAQP
jgi:hypothetical protein